jgi:hypothetical protein
MALFATKSMTHIFAFPDKATLWSEMPSSWKKDTPFHTPITSEWESQLYDIILRVFQRSMLDESVTVGMVVLLDLLGDVYRMGKYLAGDRCRLDLRSYPHDNYISFAMAAFMLSYRLLSKDRPVKEGFWEQVMEDVIAPHKVHRLENKFRELLEENSKRYPPPPISPQDRAYQIPYDPRVPPNPLIHRKPYLRTKWNMYVHIRMAMRSRGEENLTINPKSGYDAKGLLLQYPPCDDYMMKRDVLFFETRTRVSRSREKAEQVEESIGGQVA